MKKNLKNKKSLNISGLTFLKEFVLFVKILKNIQLKMNLFVTR